MNKNPADQESHFSKWEAQKSSVHAAMTYDAAELATLREIAQKATPGPWEISHDRIHSEAGRIVVYAYAPKPECGRAGDYYECSVQSSSAKVKAKPEDYAHIAAFDPPTVLSLIDALEKAQEDVGRVAKLLELQAEAKSEARIERDSARALLRDILDCKRPVALGDLRARIEKELAQ